MFPEKIDLSFLTEGFDPQPEIFQLRVWISKAVKISQPANYSQDKVVIKDVYNVPNCTVVCHDGVLPNAIYYAIKLEDKIVGFTPGSEPDSPGVINITDLDEFTGWYFPRDSYFYLSDGFLDERINNLKELIYYGSGKYPTDVNYNPTEFNSQHFLSLLKGELYSPEVDGTDLFIDIRGKKKKLV